MFFNAIFLFYIQWFYTIKSSSSHIICLYIKCVWDAWLNKYLLLIVYIVSALLSTSIFLSYVVVVSPLFYLYYSIIHTNLLYFGYLLSYLFASRRCRLVLKPYYFLYISIPIYYTTNWNHVNPLLSEAQKIVENLKCSISSTAYMEQRIKTDTTIYMHRHDVIYDGR